MKPRELIKRVEKHGFYFIRQSGSHAIYRDFLKKRQIVIPMHNRDIPTGTLHAILKDAGIALK